jgi:hypothetical protein
MQILTAKVAKNSFERLKILENHVAVSKRETRNRG